LPSGKYRAVVRYGGAKRSSEAVPTKAEARMLEAKLKLEMGSQPSTREQHSVGEVVSGHLADGAVRLSPATLDFYRKGHDAMPDAERMRAYRARLRERSERLVDPDSASAAIVENRRLCERLDQLGHRSACSQARCPR
jgi:hypothetical protein